VTYSSYTQIKISSKNLTIQYSRRKEGKYSNTVLHQSLLNADGHVCITTIFGEWWLEGWCSTKSSPLLI